MSDATAEHDPDLQEEIARIRRAQVASDKFQAEQRKLIAEAATFERQRRLAPVLIAASLGAGVMAGFISLVGRLMR